MDDLKKAGCDRREFLKRAGAAAALAAMAPGSVLAGERMRLTADGPASDNIFGPVPSAGTDKFTLEWQDFSGILKHTFTISGSSRSSTAIVLSRLSWNGYVGYGEAALPPYLPETQTSVHDFLKRASAEVLPRFEDPFCIEDILTTIDALAEANTAAKASIDIALHDLVGKIIGQPWWRIWGFNPDSTPCTSFTIGYDADDSIVQLKTDEAAWAKVIKVKLGMGDMEDRRMIRLIRERNPLTPIYIDANQGWSDKYYAMDMIGWLQEQGVVMIEQPMSKYDLDSHAWLTERSPLPIIADEACQRLVDVPGLCGAYSGINIKLMKCTGIREAREMISLAKALKMRLMIGCMTETSVAISAAAQLSPQMEWADLDGNILLANDCFTGMKLTDGKITLTTTPGLGVSPL